MSAISETYKGTTYSVEFHIGHPLRWSPKGKHWPKTTQCVIKQGDLVIGVGEVVKHAKDNENPKYARMYAAKKAFAKTQLWTEIRQRLWQQILK